MKRKKESRELRWSRKAVKSAKENSEKRAEILRRLRNIEIALWGGWVNQALKGGAARDLSTVKDLQQFQKAQEYQCISAKTKKDFVERNEALVYLTEKNYNVEGNLFTTKYTEEGVLNYRIHADVSGFIMEFSLSCLYMIYWGFAGEDDLYSDIGTELQEDDCELSPEEEERYRTMYYDLDHPERLQMWVLDLQKEVQKDGYAKVLKQYKKQASKVGKDWRRSYSDHKPSDLVWLLGNNKKLFCKS